MDTYFLTILVLYIIFVYVVGRAWLVLRNYKLKKRAGDHTK